MESFCSQRFDSIERNMINYSDQPVLCFLHFREKNYVDTTWRQRNNCGKVVNPIDICPVRKQIMAFGSFFFFPFFPELTKPISHKLSLGFVWGRVLLQLRLSPTPCPSHPSLKTSLPLCACLLESRVLGYNICLTSLRTVQVICPESY